MPYLGRAVHLQHLLQALVAGLSEPAERGPDAPFTVDGVHQLSPRARTRPSAGGSARLAVAPLDIPAAG
ncbi:hypothetical protein GCM10023170_088590 [Phytohabitans houttuyneae]|uniref:Uncharacterized protein n=1 Tax=Phytohabitans houttuyneae TaxID=1076126 RepID=A0A6V8K4Z0_9ACTN|nr:hypothetical protein Phou_016410 [Phytohabitans houttuyneae]